MRAPSCRASRAIAVARRDRLLDDFVTRGGAVRTLAEEAPERARAGQALIEPEDVPADVLQTIAAREMRFDIGPKLRENRVAIGQRRAEYLVLDLGEAIRLVVRGAAEHDAIDVLQMLVHV